MASSPPPFRSAIFPSLRRTRPSLQVRAQSCRDEGGRSSNSVDANLRVLRERIEEVRIKERSERCCKSENGWNYQPRYDYHHKTKKSAELSHQFSEFFGLVILTSGFTIASCTLCLCLVSLLVHMNQ